MKPTIHVIANKGLKMSSGKLAAQAGHAVAGAILLSDESKQKLWQEALHRWMLVFQAEDEAHLQAIAFYLTERGYQSHMVCDEGVNEIRPFSFTALGVEILDKDDPQVQGVFGGLKLYRDPKPEVQVSLTNKAKRFFNI